MAEGQKRLGLAKSRKIREAALEAAFSIVPNPEDPKYHPPLGGGGRGLLARKHSPALPTIEGPTETPGHNSPTVIPRRDRPTEAPRVDPRHEPRVDPRYPGETVAPLSRGDRPAEGPRGDHPAEESIPLSPLQWEVLQALKLAAQTCEVISYRQLAVRINAKPRGVERAVEVIQREGGIVSKTTVRTATTQGFKVEVNLNARFHQVERNVTYGVLKRGGTGTPRWDGATGTPRWHRHSMSVCKNTNILAEDLDALLRLPPAGWGIRQQTLIQIAEAFPLMSALEFRRSILYLIEQTKAGKTEIKNFNAWLKGAFEKNGGPLVTEREIEARLDQKPTGVRPVRPGESEEQIENELAVLRRYMSASPAERAEIDKLAEERAAPLLKVISQDNRSGIIEEARLEAIREYFAKKFL